MYGCKLQRTRTRRGNNNNNTPHLASMWVCIGISSETNKEKGKDFAVLLLLVLMLWFNADAY